MKTSHRVIFILLSCLLIFGSCSSAFAIGETTDSDTTGGSIEASSPLKAVNNLTDFILSIVKALGVIALIFGLVSLGMAFKSHNPDQKAQALWVIGGALIMTFVKDIIDIIQAG